MSTARLQRRADQIVARFVTPTLRKLGVREPVLRGRRWVHRAIRTRAEARGSDRFSRPALHDLERKLDAAIDIDHGFFVEAGANDGFNQSNTYWLERFRGWQGILVEPMPIHFRECKEERPAAIVVHAALVPHDHEGETVHMQFGDLMSSVHGAHGDANAEREWVEAGLALGWRDPHDLDVPARTLSSILDEHQAPEVDLLSLDVEGFEPQALRGLDLERHAPRWIVVEAHDIEVDGARIEAVLGPRYVRHAQMSPLDLLYRRRDTAAPDEAH